MGMIRAQVSSSAQVLENLPSSLHMYVLRIVRNRAIARNALEMSGLVWFATHIRLATISRKFTSTVGSSSLTCLRSNDGEAQIGLFLVIPKRSETFRMN